MAIKTTKKTTKPAPRKAAPIKNEETVTNSKCGCGCRCGGFWRFVKKLVIFVIIFALGFAACKAMCMCKTKKMMHKRAEMHANMFVNGCLDISKVRCPEMAQKVLLADANADGCITKEEFKSFKMEKRSKKMNKRGEGYKGNYEKDCEYDND